MPDRKPGDPTPERPDGTFHDLPHMQKHLDKARGAWYLGYPVAEFTRDELMVAFGCLIGEIEGLRDDAHRTAEMHDMFRRAREAR